LYADPLGSGVLFLVRALVPAALSGATRRNALSVLVIVPTFDVAGQGEN
jgi:hypothetical protein